MSDDFDLLNTTALTADSIEQLAEREDVAERRRRLDQPRRATALQDPRLGAVRYQASERLRVAINTALALEMPLLIAGEPGTGKTQVAWFIAAAFGLGDPLMLPVRSTTTASDLVYTFDAVGDFRDGAPRAPAAEPPATLNRARHIKRGPLWRAVVAKAPKVILIDEVDKAPRDFPNDLLDVLDRFEFPVPELERCTKDEVREHFKDELTPRDGQWWVSGDGDRTAREDAEQRRRPIVVLTTNSERRLPEPFLRRCIFHVIEFNRELVKRIVEARRADYPKLEDTERNQAVEAFMRLREEPLRKNPSTAELLGWLRLLNAARGRCAELGNVPGRLPLLEALIKTKEDLDALQADGR